MISQKMSATIEKDGRAGYKGTFLDGAEGKGLDVVAGRSTIQGDVVARAQQAQGRNARASPPTTIR